MSCVTKPNLPKKFPFLEKDLFGRLFTLNAEFTNREAVGRIVESLLKPRGFDLIGRLGKKDQLVQLTFADIPGEFPLDKEALVKCVAQGTVQLEVGMLWFPPAVFETFESPRARLELTLGFPKGWSYEDAEDLFVDAVQALVPHWGELNRIAATKFPTLCTLNGHHYCVPHLGTTNYFGPEYCEFFGGLERIKSVGFERVVPLSNGVLTSLGAALTQEVYMRFREEVESRLAPLETFDPNASVNVPRLRH